MVVLGVCEGFSLRRTVTQTMRFGDLLDGDIGQLRKGQAIFAYAEALKATRRSSGGPAAAAAVNEARTKLARAADDLPGDADLAEIGVVLSAL